MSRAPPPALGGGLTAGVVDEDAAHQARGDAVEVRAALPVDLRGVDQPQIGFVDQRGGLEGMVAVFLAQITARELAQFLVHQRHELVWRGGVPVAPGEQQARDFVRGGVIVHGGAARAVRVPFYSKRGMQINFFRSGMA